MLSRMPHFLIVYSPHLTLHASRTHTQAFTGINTVVFYSTTIFELAGVDNTVRDRKRVQKSSEKFFRVFFLIVQRTTACWVWVRRTGGLKVPRSKADKTKSWLRVRKKV